MSKPKLNVGLIGYQFMGKAHSNAYRQVGRFFDLPVDVGMRTICGRTEGAVKQAAEAMGWDSYETDWRKVLDECRRLSDELLDVVAKRRMDEVLRPMPD